MGIFSKTCEYAIRAVFYISQKSHTEARCGIKEIAKHIGSPEYFLAKILQKLSKKGIVKSVKGPHGGFYLDTQSFQRPLSDIVIAVDGNDIFTGCAMGLKQCSEESPCPLHKDFKQLRNQLINMLNENTIGQFNEQLMRGEFSLNK